ncbi:MAG: 30S ribosome-binding factor RbfA [Dehalococcoidales bacterium]|jgi:ribosome-binding factor A
MSYRIERVNTLMQREISELIQRQLRDPRLDEFISVTEVSVSPDLRFAQVYISSMGGQQKEHQILAALNSASGFLRSELAKNVRLRRMPELHFHWDNSIEKGDRVLRLIDEVTHQENP